MGKNINIQIAEGPLHFFKSILQKNILLFQNWEQETKDVLCAHWRAMDDV